MKKQLRGFIQATKADELIISGQIFDHRARLRSHEIAAEVRDELAAALD